MRHKLVQQSHEHGTADLQGKRCLFKGWLHPAGAKLPEVTSPLGAAAVALPGGELRKVLEQRSLLLTPIAAPTKLFPESLPTTACRYTGSKAMAEETLHHRQTLHCCFPLPSSSWIGPAWLFR